MTENSCPKEPEDDILCLPKDLKIPEDVVYKWASWDRWQYNLKGLNESLFFIVPPERHPELWSDNSVEGAISRKNMFLIERSKHIESIIEGRLDRIGEALLDSDEHTGLMSPKAAALADLMLNRRQRYTRMVLDIPLKDVERLKMID